MSIKGTEYGNVPVFSFLTILRRSKFIYHTINPTSQSNTKPHSMYMSLLLTNCVFCCLVFIFMWFIECLQDFLHFDEKNIQSLIPSKAPVSKKRALTSFAKSFYLSPSILFSMSFHLCYHLCNIFHFFTINK